MHMSRRLGARRVYMHTYIPVPLLYTGAQAGCDHDTIDAYAKAPGR